MSNPWEVPDHTNPIGHHVPNPTPQGPPPMQLGDGGNWAPPPAAAPLPGGGNWSPATSVGVPARKMMWLAILLAMLLGPIGLFYVSFLNGVAALVVLPVIVRTLLKTIIASSAGGGDLTNTLIVPLVWMFTVPWAVIGVKIRNARNG
jgi:hypothetical protein